MSARSRYGQRGCAKGERGVRKSLHEEKIGYSLVQSRRDHRGTGGEIILQLLEDSTHSCRNGTCTKRCLKAHTILILLSAASTSDACKRQHYARPRHVSFDERSHKLITFAVESFGRLGVQGSYSIDQLAASVVGGRNGGSIAKMGVLKERLLQIVSVTAQVAISRRVSRFQIQLGDRQEARRSQGGGDDRHTPMAWAWSMDAE